MPSNSIQKKTNLTRTERLIKVTARSLQRVNSAEEIAAEHERAPKCPAQTVARLNRMHDVRFDRYTRLRRVIAAETGLDMRHVTQIVQRASWKGEA